MADTNLGVRWDLLAGLGKNFVDSYDAGQKAALEEQNRSRLAALGPNASPQDLARAALQGGDSKSALAALGLAQTGAMNDYNQRIGILDLGLKRQQIEASQAQSAAQLAQSQAAAGVRPGPGGTAQIIPGSTQDPAVIERRKAAEATSRETPAEDKRAIFQSEELVKSRQRALDALNEAERLNNGGETFSGIGATLRGNVNASLPEWSAPFSARQRGLNTLRLNNIMGKQAVGHLKETFGGAPSNAEGAAIKQLESGEDAPTEIRRQIIADAKKAVQDTIDIHANRLKQLRAGTYFDPAGRPGTQAREAAPAAPAGGLVVPGAAQKFTEGQIVSQKSTNQRFQMKGGKLVPYTEPSEE